MFNLFTKKPKAVPAPPAPTTVADVLSSFKSNVDALRQIEAKKMKEAIDNEAAAAEHLKSAEEMARAILEDAKDQSKTQLAFATLAEEEARRAAKAAKAIEDLFEGTL